MEKYGNILIILGFIVLTILGFFMLPKSEIVENTASLDSNESIYVHIVGEVYNPGLIEVKFGTRIYDLIEMAGGATENADLSRINLASIVVDEQKVVVPAKIVLDDENAEEFDNGLININTAGREKLMKLDGIGEGTADKIIKYREQNGYFNCIEDILNVSGIGQSKFERIKEDISV